MCKVYTAYCGTSEIEHGLCACAVNDPLAKARGLSLRTGAHTMLYHLFKRTTCIKAQKWPHTKLTHIVMNNSCVVPLTETGMEIGDRHYIWGQNGVKGHDP